MLGVDEAGRGPVIGPLVVAGVCANDATLTSLTSSGVRDSKALSPASREELSLLIRARCEVRTVSISARDIDLQRSQMSLNDIERRMFADVIKMFDDINDIIVVDCCDTKEERFGSLLSNDTGKDVLAKHKADDTHPAVSAASIIAKVERDRAVAAISRQAEAVWGIGVGSGYPSDPKTKAFLKKVAGEAELPEFVRRSWKTVTALSQSSLDAYYE
jgi:ribonuclease HII